jgi:hypothetical protein
MNHMQRRARRRKAFAAKRVAKAMLGNGALSWKDRTKELECILWNFMKQGLVAQTNAQVRRIHDELLIDLPLNTVTIKGKVNV